MKFYAVVQKKIVRRAILEIKDSNTLDEALQEAGGILEDGMAEADNLDWNTIHDEDTVLSVSESEPTLGGTA